MVAVFLDIEIYNPSRINGSLAALGYVIVVLDVKGGKLFPTTAEDAALYAEGYSVVRPPPGCEENTYCSAIHKITADELQAGQPYPVVANMFVDSIEAVVAASGPKVTAVLFVAHNGAVFFFWFFLCFFLVSGV